MKQIIATIAIAGIAIMSSCSNSAVKQQEAAMKAQQYTIDSMKMELARQQIIDSMNEVSRMKIAAIPVAHKAVTKKRSTRSRSYARTNSGTLNGSTGSGGYANNSNDGIYTPPAETQKKGWSAKAKGAVIGGVAGAVGGAIINKRNPTAGGVIGGVLGAAAGTGIGAIIDKKNGR
jgi:hypothetical protein